MNWVVTCNILERKGYISKEGELTYDISEALLFETRGEAESYIDDSPHWRAHRIGKVWNGQGYTLIH